MIIFNGKEYKSPYTKNEKRIVEINTPLSYAEMLNKLIKKEPFEDGQVSITNYEYGNEELAFFSESDESTNNINSTYYDEDEIETMYNIPYQRPIEFKTFESYQFGQNVAVNFEVKDISDDLLLTEMKAAYGTLPKLMDEPLTAEELSKYNNLGSQLIIPAYNLSADNPCPTIQEIDHFASMNDYEKRLICEGRVHPYKLFKIMELIKKEISPNYILNTDILDYIVHHSRQSITQIVKSFEEGQIIPNLLSEEAKEKIVSEFTQQYKFSPRIANEYIIGRCLRDGRDPESVIYNTPDLLQEYIKEFNRTSVSQIAKTKSIYLLGISNEINFAAFPAKLTNVLSVYLNKVNYKILNNKELFKWIQKHTDVNPSELCELIKKNSLIRKYEGDLTAKQILDKAKNAKGIEDCKKFAGDSHWNLNGKPFDFSKNEIAIKGRHIIAKQGDIVMRMLPADDYANFTIGYDTTCCQHYGDAGQSCVFKYTTDPFAAAVVIEEKGKVKAQGFVWTDETNSTLVFDNVEFAGNNSLDNQLASKFRDIFYEWVKACPYKNVHVGVGYNAAMNGWGKKITYEAVLPTTIDGSTNRSGGWGNGNCYSDYHKNAKALKKDGQMLLTRNTNIDIQVTSKPDEPTKWDQLATPELAFMLNDYKHTIEERLEYARKIKDNPDAAFQLKIIKDNPNTISAFENIDTDVQIYILNNYPDKVSLIKNPIPEITFAEISKDPQKILDIENPDDFAIGLALSKDGTLLSYFINTTTENILKAVNQNGTAIQFLPREKITHDIENAAIENNPKAITLYASPSEDIIAKAIEKEPSLISGIDNPSWAVKESAISANPSLILEIKNPRLPEETAEDHNEHVKRLWEIAVSKNGYLIRNCGRSFPEFRSIAIRQNAYAATVLPDISPEEIKLAVDQTPDVCRFFKKPEFRSYAFEYADEKYGVENVKRNNILEIRQPEQMSAEHDSSQIEYVS